MASKPKNDEKQVTKIYKHIHNQFYIILNDIFIFILENHFYCVNCSCNINKEDQEEINLHLNKSCTD